MEDYHFIKKIFLRGIVYVNWQIFFTSSFFLANLTMLSIRNQLQEFITQKQLGELRQKTIQLCTMWDSKMRPFQLRPQDYQVIPSALMFNW